MLYCVATGDTVVKTSNTPIGTQTSYKRFQYMNKEPNKNEKQLVYCITCVATEDKVVKTSNNPVLKPLTDDFRT